MNAVDKELNIPFTLINLWSFTRFGVPLRSSIPLPQGAVRDPGTELCLCDAEGCDLTAQWRILSRWPDGSTRFDLYVNITAKGIK